MPRKAVDIESACGAELYFWEIAESVEELAELLPDGMELLDEACGRFKSVQRRREWLAARVLLQNTAYSGRGIVYDTNGAPKLHGGGKHISISHTGNIVAIAVSDTRIGLDIETGERNAFAVARMFLKENEMKSIGNGGCVEALLLWTVKESAFKLASENATVLKEIETEFKCEENGVYTYDIKYPNGKKAVCSTYITCGLFISVSSLM